MPKTKTVIEDAVRMGAKNQVTIPHRISKALHLKKGDHMLVRMVGKTVELVPATIIPMDQRWFWTPEWQTKEREADEDIAQGRVKEFASVDELIKDLKS